MTISTTDNTFSASAIPEGLRAAEKFVDSSIGRSLRAFQTFPKSNFQHEPINTANGEIRLFKLLSDLDGHYLIQCEIFLVRLDDAPAYRAISYEWGPSQPTRPILVNGSPLKIRKNLWLFLDVLRRRTTETDALLWADQICIDQMNVKERNHQVRLMGTLYSRADKVLAWLGPVVPGDLIDPAVILEKHSMYIGPDCSPDCKLQHRCACLRCDKASCQYRHECGGSCAACDYALLEAPSKKPYFELLSYWNRLWIIQELVLAKEIVLFVGR